MCVRAGVCMRVCACQKKNLTSSQPLSPVAGPLSSSDLQSEKVRGVDDLPRLSPLSPSEDPLTGRKHPCQRSPGYWTMRERAIARGFRSFSLVGVAGSIASNQWVWRTAKLPPHEREALRALHDQRRDGLLYPDAWLDLVDAALDRAYFKTPMPEGMR